LLTDRFEDIRDDPSIKVVAEVMGGVEPTLGYLQELLERGVSVVSANKQLLARYGAELQQAADRGGAQLRYEASACAAIPVVRVLQESLAAAGVDELIGIVNGTTNFMLTAMARDGRSYADALAEAQQLGYAEADPTEDVGGADAAAKLAILASLAFHRHLHIDDVPFEGIDTLHDDDVAFANELGYAVKLLALARLSSEGIAARVAPVLVPHEHPLFDRRLVELDEGGFAADRAGRGLDDDCGHALSPLFRAALRAAFAPRMKSSTPEVVRLRALKPHGTNVQRSPGMPPWVYDCPGSMTPCLSRYVICARILSLRFMTPVPAMAPRRPRRTRSSPCRSRSSFRFGSNPPLPRLRLSRRRTARHDLPDSRRRTKH
jgi:hypothetical protein